MGFFSQLEERAKEIDSLLCIGLDPHLEDLPAPDSQSALDFCLRLVEATSDFTLAYKPNIAFFEIFGSSGIAALETVIANIPDEIPIILDAKRGDIASSAQAYAKAIFETLGANAVTVNPYLGFDAIEPFLKDEQRGVFLLCKTSNPGAADVQDLNVSTAPDGDNSVSSIKIFELIATKALEWNKNDNLGLVVGATQTEALAGVRTLAPDLWILAPGVGAQGANLETALMAGLRSDGLGMVVPISRGISREADPGLVAREINKNINLARRNLKRPATSDTHSNNRMDQDLKILAIDLLKSGCVEFGEFKLKSGLHSPIYIDLRRLVGYPELLKRVAESYIRIMEGINFDRLAALPYAGLPIATAISLQGDYPLVYPRKETKSHGTQAEIEGIYSVSERVVLIDDLATTGGSKFEAIKKLQAASLIVKDVVVLIDRQSGAAEDLEKSGYRMHAIFTLTQLLDYWSTAKLISKDQIDSVQDFISTTGSNNAN
jgi:uridine monophosphate synthetase